VTLDPPAPADEPQVPEAQQPAPGELPGGLGERKLYKRRIWFVYALLALVLVGSVVALLGFHVNTSSSTSSSGWSDWKPNSGTTSQMATQIADHVSQQYHLNKAGSPLVAVVAGPPQVTAGTRKISVSTIAVKKAAKSAAGIDIVPSGGIWKEQLCGIGGAGCSIASGKPTEMRGRLVRREALEIALYTFKFVPSIKSIVAFMPPPAGSPPSTLLYLQKDNLKQQLDQPLSKTLPLLTPPLPTNADKKEAATIDRLTLPAVFSYNYQQLQDASALLVLSPFQT
jgi:hypothetical protein